MDVKDYWLNQIDIVLRRCNRTFVNLADLSEFCARGVAVVYRITNFYSAYRQLVWPFCNDSQIYEDNSAISRMIGILRSLRADIEAGFVNSLGELVRGELFSDFLEMADYLVKEGYKDAAAIMGGGVLETHIHQLCIRNDI